MSNPKITQVTAFKAESTTEVYDSHRDAAIAEACYALNEIFEHQATVTAYDIAEKMAENIAMFRKILRLF